ncbi:DUF4233 domain-containing protein [Pedococcus sp.]|jgi:hypothetical protein|uniref:DUF4233 domain-containing protein n=1 Tax=Pedococcus sp. TaxID=2860345 RepID=UPI002E0F20B7|nr:DUF4233 domain-containing protein [Pedococcus sp.]
MVVFYGSLGRFTWRMLATVLAAQGIVVFLGALVARGLANAVGDDRDSTWLWVGIGLAVLCFVAAGLMRHPWGVTLGWLIQVATFASAAVVPAMLAVGVIFLALWVGSLILCRRVEDQMAARERTPDPR